MNYDLGYYTIKLYEKLKKGNNNKYLERFNHSIGVSVTACQIAKSNNLALDYNKLYLIGLLHDYCKYTKLDEYECVLKKNNMSLDILNESPKVLHGIVGYLIIKEELNIADDEILNAIRYHVFGKDNMNEYESIIYLADFIEPNRDISFPEIEKYAYSDYKKAVYYASKNLIEYLQSIGGKIHENSYITYNYYKKYVD